MRAATACRDAAQLLADRFELSASVQEPLLATADGQQIGTARIFAGDGAVRSVVLVTLSLGQMVSGMLCAFTPPDSGVPHFALDVIDSPEGLALHLDLLPRVDLATHAAYLRVCLDPLSSAAAALLDQPGVQQTTLPLRQLALMSRWALTCRVEPGAAAAATAAVDAYLGHWLTLAAGLPADVQLEYAGEDLAARDLRHRASLFDPDLDPVWPMLTNVVGHASSELVRRALSAEPSSEHRPRAVPAGLGGNITITSP